MRKIVFIIVLVLVTVQRLVAVETTVIPTFATEPVARIATVNSPEVGKLNGSIFISPVQVKSFGSISAAPLWLNTAQLQHGSALPGVSSLGASIGWTTKGVGGSHGFSSGVGISMLGVTGAGGGYVSAEAFLSQNKANPNRRGETTLESEVPDSEQATKLTRDNDVGVPLPDGMWILLVLALGYMVRTGTRFDDR